MDLRARVFAAIAVLLAFTILGSAVGESAATFEAGESAYIAGKFDEARAAYAASAASSTASPKDRASSLRQLAIMAWRLDGDAAAAERRFAEALAVGADLSRTYAQRARFYAIAKRYDEAAAAAEAAVATAVTNADRNGAAFAFARAVRAKLEGVNIPRQTVADRKLLARARGLVAAVSQNPPLPLDLSEALLEIALRLDDGPLALVAWRSYAREGVELGPWAPAGRRLTVALSQWRGGPPTARQRSEIFEGLATSQFFDLAVLMASDDRVDETAAFVATPRVADVVAYAALIAESRSLTESYYRDIANRRADSNAWRAALTRIAETLWAQLHFDGARPSFTLEAAAAELERRFGAYVSIGQTGSYDDMHYAHIFVDDARTIEQYGHRAQIRRIALDRIVSNGYESWLWDGRQAHGGWARTDRVYQVRPGYADGALREWEHLTDPKQRAEEEERIARLLAGDDDIARRDPAAYLPGLAARLDWQGENAILNRLRASGVGPQDLKQRFIIDYNRIGLDANFFAHEGRHVLDKQAFGTSLSSEELEFRAKLSEIAFSEEPRMSFGPITNPNIADQASPHGRANKRIMQGLVAWMTANSGAIADLDQSHPLLPQLDKLTDDQLRAAMRSMDPWAPRN